MKTVEKIIMLCFFLVDSFFIFLFYFALLIAYSLIFFAVSAISKLCEGCC